MASLQCEIENLTQKLHSVTVERNELVNRIANTGTTPPDRPGSSNGSAEMQSQRYEERIVELHSVIAELSRKLEDQRDDVIREEESELEETGSQMFNEEEEPGFVSDSCPDEDEQAYEEGEDDCSSLAFERDLEHHTRSLREKRGARRRVIAEESCQFPMGQRDFESEIFKLQQEMMALRSENDDLKCLLANRDEEANVNVSIIEQLRSERDNLRRQLEDIKNTVEYQEAKMEENRQQKRVVSPSLLQGNPNSRSSSERRSLRRRRTAGSVAREAKKDTVTQVS